MFNVLACITVRHDWRLVVVAAAVCVLSVVSTFYLYSKTPELGRGRRLVWFGLAGLVGGCGIWTTHFVAMLAFRTGLPNAFNVPETLGSLVVGVASTQAGLAIAGAIGRPRYLNAVVGGVVIGLGVTAMHYVGMLGYRTAGELVWDPAYVAASVALGAMLSAAAMVVVRRGVTLHRMLIASGLLVLGIVGMHFTGMSAVTIRPDPQIIVPPSLLTNDTMATIAVVVAAFIIVTAILGVILDNLSRNGSAKRLRQALDAMTDGIAFFDASDRLVAWNSSYDRFCRDRGTTLKFGQTFADIISQGLRAGAFPEAEGREEAWLAERVAQHLRSGSTTVFRDAKNRWLRVTERRTKDGGVVLSGVNITDIKQAEIAVAESQERFRRLAMNAPDMIAECTLEGVMTYVSPASTAITGFTPEELVGRTFASLMDAADAAEVLAMCQAVFVSKGALAPWPVEFRAQHKDGRQLWLECKPTMSIDPVTKRALGVNDVIRDITARKQMEADLRAAQEAAEAASLVKTEFLANMSHELRTPLTSIIGFTGLVSEQADLSDLTRGYVARVANASRALLCTVNDILDFSKLEAGQVSIHTQPVRLAELTQATLDLFTPQAGAKDLDLILDDAGTESLVLAIDPDRVRQVLLNLVGNAVKFTAAGMVTLRTRYDAEIKELRVEILDSGAGIPADKLPRLFQRFSQIDGSLTRSQAGTGLGLAICKGLVEAMGGEIGMDSEIGVGSRFWFRIPAPPAHLAQRATPAGPDRLTVEGVRVLVVDDHPTNRDLARLYLSGLGAEVTEACDGLAAVEQAQAWPFDVILMDLRMPNLDGIGALRQIRAQPGPNDATPCLAFSADVSADLKDELLTAGFDGAVAKPIQAEALIHAVAAAANFEPVRERHHVLQA